MTILTELPKSIRIKPVGHAEADLSARTSEKRLSEIAYHK